MDRLALVELIEDQAARLTPQGRDLAERMELLAEALPSRQAATYETQRAQSDAAPAAVGPEHPRAAADAVGGA